MDFKALRSRMVEEQLMRRDIKDDKILRAFEKVPRHEFVPGTFKKNAHADYPLGI